MLQNQKLTVKPLDGQEIPKFPKYRKQFTSYSALARIGRDAKARGVDYYVEEIGPDKAWGYIVVANPEVEDPEDHEKIGIWISEPAK